MSYRIVQRQDYRYPVTVSVVGDNGATLTHTFDAVFKRFDQQQIDEIRSSGLTDEELSRKVLVGWHGVQDESGVELTFNEENLTRLLADNGLRWSIAKAWFSAIEKELQKN